MQRRKEDGSYFVIRKGFMLLVFMSIESLLNETNLLISEKNGQIKEKTEFIKSRQKENKEYEDTFNTNLKKKFLLQEACDTARKTSYDRFAIIATSGLQQIFGKDISVEIVSGEKNSVPTANFMVRTKYDGYETFTNPTDSDGGGVADIISLSAFICMNILYGDKNTAPLFLDEPTKFVSAGYASSVAKFIKEISEEYNKQIIMVTHAKETQYSADAVFNIALDDTGKSVVEEVTTD